MLQTIEAEIDERGNVRLLEPVHVTKPTRALVTLLEGPAEPIDPSGSAAKIQTLLNSPAFANRASYPAEEIDAQIRENRQSWD